MKIAVISNQAFSLINFRGPLLLEMKKRGHEVLAFAPDFDAETRSALQVMGVQAVDFSMNRSGANPFKEMMVILRLLRMLKRVRPDICFSIFLKPVIYSTFAATLAGVPKRYGLIAGLGYAFSTEPDQKKVRRLTKKVVIKLSRLATLRINGLYFQNKDDHCDAVSAGMVSKDKAILVGATGVELDKWKPAPIPEDRVTFIIVARMIRDKGIEEYVVAARTLRSDFPDARFIILGALDDNPTAISRAEIDGWVKEGVVEWPGHVSVRPWLEQSSVFVLPSYYREGVPRSTQEAMAMGRPVITTDCPGCRETVIDGLNGFFVPPRDPAALAEAMKKFLIEPNLIPEMGRYSRKISEERFSAQVQNAKLLELMEIF